jgi:hypothetical protein
MYVGPCHARTFFFAFSCAVCAAFNLFLYSLHRISAQYVASAAFSHWQPDDDADQVSFKTTQ